MMIDTLRKGRKQLITLAVALAAIGILAMGAYSDPAKIIDDYVYIDSETWRVWTEYDGNDDEIYYNRIIDGESTDPELVNVNNATTDADAAITYCEECPMTNEKVWVAWERYDTGTGDTDIIMSTRSIGSLWGGEIWPHCDNYYDDFNADVFGDSSGRIWIAWVSFLHNEYQLRYTYYNGQGIANNSNWWDDIVVHEGDLYDGSSPKIYEDFIDNKIKVQWKDSGGENFTEILVVP